MGIDTTVFPEPMTLTRTRGPKYRKQECFLCGNKYTEAQSIEAGTSADFVSMYCSSECELEDKASIEDNTLAPSELEFKTTEQIQHDATINRIKSLSGFDMRMQASATRITSEEKGDKDGK